MDELYLAHSSSFDFKSELYLLIRKSKLNQDYEIILPHENYDEPFDSKNCLKDCKVIIAEVSYPSIGLGIELGWADLYGVPIIFIYKKGRKISTSLKVLSNNFIEYSDVDELLEKLSFILKDV